MKTLKIGSVQLKNRYILAPMAGTTDMVFRSICSSFGAGMVCTEMVSAKAVSYGDKKSQALMEISPDEAPVSLQIFGSDPVLMGEVAAAIEGLPFSILDINMGCPVKKVFGNGEGSALMKDPHLAADIVRQITRRIKKPVTAKIRSGVDAMHINAVEVARRLEDAGASAVAVHGRTREQLYRGQADWDVIRQVKEAVDIPVIGSGDVTDPPSAERMLRETGCDGVMIGRAARGNPWIFKDLEDYEEKGTYGGRPGPSGIRDMILYHTQRLIEQKGERMAILQMRTHAPYYSRGLSGAASLREKINNVNTYGELEKVLAFFPEM